MSIVKFTLESPQVPLLWAVCHLLYNLILGHTLHNLAAQLYALDVYWACTQAVWQWPADNFGGGGEEIVLREWNLLQFLLKTQILFYKYKNCSLPSSAANTKFHSTKITYNAGHAAKKYFHSNVVKKFSKLHCLQNFQNSITYFSLPWLLTGHCLTTPRSLKEFDKQLYA